jgi:hypothetical protein
MTTSETADSHSEQSCTPLPDHRPVYPENGMTQCSCGKATVQTYVGWKRHYSAEKRKHSKAE